MVRLAGPLLIATAFINEAFATFQSLADCDSAYATLQGKEGVTEATSKETRDELESTQEKNAEQAEQLKSKDKEIAVLQENQHTGFTPSDGPSAGTSDTPMDRLASELAGLMNHFQFQYVFGIAFAALGLLSVLFAEYFTVSGSILVAASAVGAMVHHESPPSWHPNDADGEAALVGLVAALLTAMACHQGLQGFQVLMGASLGTLVALLVGCFVSVSGWNLQLQMGFYIGLALVGAVVTYGARARACAFFGPLVGGLWVAGSTVYFAASILGASEVTWLNSLDAVLNGSDKSDAAVSLSDKWETVRLVSFAVWGSVFFTGFLCSFAAAADEDQDDRDPDDYDTETPAPKKAMQAPLIGRSGGRGGGGGGRSGRSLYD